MDLIEARTWAFIQDPPPEIDDARRLLQVYSKIPRQQVDEHLMYIVSFAPCPRYVGSQANSS